MIERQKGRMTFVCDSCGQIHEADARATFHEAWGVAKEDGWKAKRVVGVWVHACPDCEIDE